MPIRSPGKLSRTLTTMTNLRNVEEEMKKEDINEETMADIQQMGQDLTGGEGTEYYEEDAETGYDSPEDDQEALQDDEPARPTLKEVIEENAREDEKPFSSTLALRTILGGDILNTQAIRRQVWLILIITLFSILYVSNRYSCQKQQIMIDKLTTDLKKAKYKTLSLSSVLTERCRESHVAEMLRANNDSTIHPADQPPYIIIIPN